MMPGFHKAFRLNGQSFGPSDLGEMAYSLVKEGNAFEREAGDFLLDWLSPQGELTVRTSGSTGKPKEIHLPKSALRASATASGVFFGLGPGSRALGCLSLRTIAGKMMLVRALVLGWDLTLIPPTSSPLEEAPGPFDFVAMVPLQLSNSIRGLREIGKVLVGGAPLPNGLLSRLPETGCEVWQSYGMTETASHVALRRLEVVPENRDPELVLPPYQALEGIRFSVDDRDCLVIHAPSRVPAPLTTNDVVRLESETRFRWLGRADHVVNSGGVKIHPEELERRLASVVPANFMLTGIPDPELGEKLVLICEGELDPTAVKRNLETQAGLGPYEKPRDVFCVSSLEYAAGGKLDRRATRNLIAGDL